MPRRPAVALVTCRDLPHLDPDDAPLVAALARLGVEAKAVVWDDSSADWSAFDLSVVRSTWDFSRRRGRFVQWAESVSRIENPAAAIRWNTDKHYLAALGGAGVPVIPTDWLEPSANLSSRKLHTRFPTMGDFVIKPAVSAGSADSGRYAAGSPRSRGLAIQHARRLLDADRTVMVQRYVTSVDVVGETGLVFLAGRFAWAVHRDAMLEGPDTGPSTALRRGHIQAVDATPAQVAVGEQALAAAATLIGVPSSRPFLTARVDVVAADDGPQVLELELTHPSLYAGLVPDGHERVAAAIAVRLQT